MDISAAVEDYINCKRKLRQKEFEFFRGQKTLFDAVEVAASCERANGKRHPHQRRIQAAAIIELKQKLLAELTTISKARSFDEIFKVVCSIAENIRGIGELTTYDVSLRIGIYLDLEPKHVYLHAGTRKGAAALGFSGKLIEKKQLPEELQALSCAEIEDYLCLHKSCLGGDGCSSRKCGEAFSTCLPSGEPC